MPVSNPPIYVPKIIYLGQLGSPATPASSSVGIFTRASQSISNDTVTLNAILGDGSTAIISSIVF